MVLAEKGIIEAARRRRFEQIAGELQALDGGLFAVVFGSAIEADRYRDIDVGLLLDRQVHHRDEDVGLQLDWGVRLSRLMGQEVDVRIVNDAPIAFKYNVTKGLPILERDVSTWPDFRERTWIV